MRLPGGKLPPELLSQLLAELPKRDPQVIVGPGLGLDAAVIALDKEQCLVAKTDPITFATDAIGWYAVQVCANDAATTGAAPRWFMATVLLPEAPGNAELAEQIMAQVRDACAALDIEVIGGHTEITCGLDRPIVCGTLLGQVERRRLVLNSGARPGDAIILTKGIAIEGTSIIAREMADRLPSHLGETFVARCKDFLMRPGISIVRDARVALEAGRVHAMHDPTEGGLSSGLWEMAQASGVGLVIEAQRVPIYAETLELCRLFDLNPWGLIASGALLLAVEAADAKSVVAALEAGGIPATVIGRAEPGAPVVRLRRPDGTVQELAPCARDEITRLFEG